MKQSTSFAQVATNLLNVLQGYTKGIRFVAVLTMLLSIGVGKAWADYTITFKTSGNNNDGSQAQTTIANLISSGGGYVSTISATKAYNGKNGYGVKLGSSSEVGNVSMNLTSNGNNIGQIKASKLIVNAAYYKTGPKLKVTVTYTDNTTVSQSLSLTASIAAYDVTLSSTKTLKSIKIESVAGSSEERVYCHSIQVVAAAAVSTYTVTYDLNGGAGTKPTQAAVAAGGTFTLAASSGFSKEGYSFAGWNDGTNTYNAGDTYTMPAKEVTLKALWTALPQYTVTWSVDGKPTTEEVYSGDKVTKAPIIDENNLPCDGADKFVGWTTDEYQGDSEPNPLYKTAAEIPAITGDITFYAVFADYAN